MVTTLLYDTLLRLLLVLAGTLPTHCYLAKVVWGKAKQSEVEVLLVVVAVAVVIVAVGAGGRAPDDRYVQEKPVAGRKQRVAVAFGPECLLNAIATCKSSLARSGLG